MTGENFESFVYVTPLVLRRTGNRELRCAIFNCELIYCPTVEMSTMQEFKYTEMDVTFFNCFNPLC